MELNFTFTLQESNIILSALRKLPMETVETLVTKLRQQAEPQLNKKIEEQKQDN